MLIIEVVLSLFFVATGIGLKARLLIKNLFEGLWDLLPTKK